MMNRNNFLSPFTLGDSAEVVNKSQNTKHHSSHLGHPNPQKDLKHNQVLTKAAQEIKILRSLQNTCLICNTTRRALTKESTTS